MLRAKHLWRLHIGIRKTYPEYSRQSIHSCTGLQGFDGEGSVLFTRKNEKKKKHNGKGYRISRSMRINMEITMTDESVIRWVHEILGVVQSHENQEKVYVKMVQNT